MRLKSVTRYTLLALLLAILPSVYGQGGQIGSTSSPITNRNGQALSGVSVSFCQPLATTSAAVTSNVAVLTMASNPITAGFAQGMTIMVSGFTGGDTYFNGGTLTGGVITSGYTILSVTSTTVTFSLVHANASAGTNGTVLQQGNATTPCAGEAAVYQDAAITVPATQPVTSDGNGNWNVFAAPGVYYVQFYGVGVTTSIKVIAIACVPTSVCSNVTTTLVLNGATSGTLTITPAAIAGSSTLQLVVAGNGAAVPTFPAATDTVVELTQTQVLTNKTIDTSGPNTIKIAGTSLTTTTGTGSVMLNTSPALNGTPTGTGISTSYYNAGSGGGDYTNSSGAAQVIDGTNLSRAITVPVGWKMNIIATAQMTHSVGGDLAALILAKDGSAVDQKGLTIPSTGNSEAMTVMYQFTGDGSPHTWALYSTGAATVTISNSSVVLAPKMIFDIKPSN